MLSDAKSVHSQWEKLDKLFFTATISNICSHEVSSTEGTANLTSAMVTSMMSVIYGFRPSFRELQAISSMNIIVQHRKQFYNTDKKKISHFFNRQPRCYNAVYDSIYILSLAFRRYQYQPIASQDIFSRTILEPILITIVGLFLYRIRSNLALYCISTGLLPYSEQLYICDDTGIVNPPASLVDFLDSVQYFQLNIETITKPYTNFISNKIRYEDKWKLMQKWFPEGSITPGDVERGYTPKGLAVFAMELSSNSTVKESNGKVVSNTKNNKLNDVIELVRAQVITMSNVMSEQWQKLMMSKLES